MQNWFFYLVNDGVECETEYKIALVKGGRDQCEVNLLKDLKGEAAWLMVHRLCPRLCDITTQKSQS